MSFADLTEKISAQRAKLLDDIATLKYQSMNDDSVDIIAEIATYQADLDVLNDLYDKSINEQADIQELYEQATKYIKMPVVKPKEYLDPVVETLTNEAPKPKQKPKLSLKASLSAASTAGTESSLVAKASETSAEQPKGYKLRAFDIKVKDRDGNTFNIIPGISLPEKIAAEIKYSATVDSIVLTFKFSPDKKIKPDDRLTALHLLRDAEKLNKPVTKAIVHLEMVTNEDYKDVYEMINKHIKRLKKSS